MHLTSTKDGQVSVRNLAKTFAAGKTAQRHLYQTLSDLGLPSGQVSVSIILYYIPICMNVVLKEIAV